MVSNIIGQGMEDRVTELVRKVLTLSVSFSIVVAILLNLFPQVFLAVYGQDASFTAAAIPVVRVLSLALILMSFATVTLNTITGTGNTRINLLIEVITIVLYCLYVYFVMERWRWSLAVGWMSEWVYWISTFTMAFFYIRSGKWKGKVI